MMTYQKLRLVLENLESTRDKNNLYIQSIPYDIKGFVNENAHSDNLYTCIDSILSSVFSSDIYNEINWYLFDRPENTDNEHNILTDNGNYLVTDIDSFMNYIMEQYEETEL